MIVWNDGSYETGSWLTKESYEGSNHFFVDETTVVGQALVSKVMEYYPNYKLVVKGNELIDVLPSEETLEIIVPLTPEQERIKQLENESVTIMLALTEAYDYIVQLEARIVAMEMR